MLTARREEHATPWETHMASVLWRALTVSDWKMEDGIARGASLQILDSKLGEVKQVIQGLETGFWGKVARLSG